MCLFIAGYLSLAQPFIMRFNILGVFDSFYCGNKINKNCH